MTTGNVPSPMLHFQEASLVNVTGRMFAFAFISSAKSNIGRFCYISGNFYFYISPQYDWQDWCVCCCCRNAHSSFRSTRGVSSVFTRYAALHAVE